MIAVVLAAGMCSATAAISLPAGAIIPLATSTTLSTRTSAKGDMVMLRVTSDVTVNGIVAIPTGTEAVAQISEARITGGMGQSGKLALQPLYLKIGDATVRLRGNRSDEGRISAESAVGLALVSPALSGRNATIEAGTRVDAEVVRAVELPARAGC